MRSPVHHGRLYLCTGAWRDAGLALSKWALFMWPPTAMGTCHHQKAQLAWPAGLCVLPPFIWPVSEFRFRGGTKCCTLTDQFCCSGLRPIVILISSATYLPTKSRFQTQLVMLHSSEILLHPRAEKSPHIVNSDSLFFLVWKLQLYCKEDQLVSLIYYKCGPFSLFTDYPTTFAVDLNHDSTGLHAMQ